MKEGDWELIAVRLALALAGIRDTRAWRLRLPNETRKVLDRAALEALQAFQALRDGRPPTDAERLAKRLLGEWEGCCCQEIDDGEWVCIECDAKGPTPAHVPHEPDCIGWLAERLVKEITT